MSFAGGGSDFRDYYQKDYGSVISTALDKYIYVTVNKKFDDLIHLRYSESQMVDNVEKVEHNLLREALKLTGEELIEFGIIDGIIAEPQGGAHRDYNQAAINLKKAILKNLEELSSIPADKLIAKRYEKFRKIGIFKE